MFDIYTFSSGLLEWFQVCFLLIIFLHVVEFCYHGNGFEFLKKSIDFMLFRSLSTFNLTIFRRIWYQMKEKKNQSFPKMYTCIGLLIEIRGYRAEKRILVIKHRWHGFWQNSQKRNACLHAVQQAVEEKILRVYTASEAKGLIRVKPTCITILYFFLGWQWMVMKRRRFSETCSVLLTRT